MRQFHTVVLERLKHFESGFATEPYEAGWAGEGIFFLTIDDLSDGTTLVPRVQISVDGINWLDEGTSFDPIRASGRYFSKVSHFGGWLRLVCDVTGEASFVGTVHLVLKE